MNKIEELKNKIEKLSEEIILTTDKLKKELDECEKSGKVNKRWRAEKYESYYYVDSDLFVEEHTERDIEEDDNRYQIHNYFVTREEAEKVAEKIKIYIELKDLAEELNEGEEIDWENEYQAKYYIYNCNENKTLECNASYCCEEIGQIYCLNKDFLEIAIERIGEERLLKLFE